MDFFSTIIQAIMSFLSNIFGGIFGGSNTQNPKPSEITGIPISGAQGAIAPQAQAAAIAPAAPPKPSAEEIMASWKQEMAASTIPQSVQLAIAAKEPQITEQLRAAKSPQEMGNIQMAAYAEATKPEWDKFVAKSKAEVSKLMDATIREVSQSGMPSKEKEEALKGLKAEKEARVKALEAELKQIAPEQRIQIALSKEGQEKIQENITNSVKNYKEAVSKNVSDISRQNNGWAWGSSTLGWGSLGLAVASLVAVPFTGGASLIPLGLTVAACGTGMAAGACKVINNSDKGGSNFDFGMGIAEIGLNAIPLGGIAAKSVGLFGKSAVVAAESTNVFSAVSKASLAEGRAIAAVDGVLASNTTYKGVTVAKGVKDAAVAEIASVLKGTQKVVTNMPAGEALDLASQAMLKAQRTDLFIGSHTNAWRAASEIGWTTTDGLIPSSTPQILPTDGMAKQPAPKL